MPGRRGGGGGGEVCNFLFPFFSAVQRLTAVTGCDLSFKRKYVMYSMTDDVGAEGGMHVCGHQT